MNFKIGERVVTTIPIGRRPYEVPKGTKVKVVGFIRLSDAAVIRVPEEYEGAGWEWRGVKEDANRELFLRPGNTNLLKLTECKHCGIEVGIGKCIYCGYENGGENGF